MPDPSPVTILFYNEEVGYGLVNHRPLKKDEVVGEYLGLVRPISRHFPHSTEYCLHYPTRFWSLRPRAVDAREWGNEMRFINHSSTPTLRLERGVKEGVIRHWFVAKEALDPGSLLTFDYGRDYWRKRRFPLEIQ